MYFVIKRELNEVRSSQSASFHRERKEKWGGRNVLRTPECLLWFSSFAEISSHFPLRTHGRIAVKNPHTNIILTKSSSRNNGALFISRIASWISYIRSLRLLGDDVSEHVRHERWDDELENVETQPILPWNDILTRVESSRGSEFFRVWNNLVLREDCQKSLDVKSGGV